MPTLMYSSRLWPLLLLVSIIAMVSADRRVYGLYKEVKRDVLSSTLTAGVPTQAPSSVFIPPSTPLSSNPPPPPAVTTTTKTTTTTSTPSTTTTSTTSAPVSSVTAPVTTPTLAPATSTPPSTTTAPAPVVTAPTQTVSVITLVSLVTESGSTYSKSIDISTTIAITTSATSLADSGISSGGGLSSSTKAVIGGVVGSIGGVIVLGVLLAVIWRLRRNRRNRLDPDDVLVNGTSAQGGVAEKDGAGSTPFQTTLESYHNPANKPVNASSNF